MFWEVSMKEKVTLAVIGIGGFGNSYVSELLDAPNQGDFAVVAVADPNPQACTRLPELKARGVAVYESSTALYTAHQPDLVVLCSPPQLHARQTLEALAHRCRVLCEKPLCSSPEEIRLMSDAEAAAGLPVAIGYQWSFNPAIQELKADIGAGKFGKPLRLRTLVLWPRSEAYYSRNRWAGRKRDVQGDWVLDSPVNNACAHYLHNMFFVLGDKSHTSAVPRTMTAEIYRAYSIENYDTAAVRCITAEGVELLFVVSHAIENGRGPDFAYEFERATIEFSDCAGDHISVRYKDGSSRSYGSPHAEPMRKLWYTVESLRKPNPPLCGIAAAASHTRCVWAIQESMPDIIDFPSTLIDVKGTPPGVQRNVLGLHEALTDCYSSWRLPSELGLQWARSGRPVQLKI
jgi:predicted dehydrogenase